MTMVPHYEHLVEVEALPWSTPLSAAPRTARRRVDDLARHGLGSLAAGHRHEHTQPRDRGAYGFGGSRRPIYLCRAQSIDIADARCTPWALCRKTRRQRSPCNVARRIRPRSCKICSSRPGPKMIDLIRDGLSGRLSWYHALGVALGAAIVMAIVYLRGRSRPAVAVSYPSSVLRWSWLALSICWILWRLLRGVA